MTKAPARIMKNQTTRNARVAQRSKRSSDGTGPPPRAAGGIRLSEPVLFLPAEADEAAPKRGSDRGLRGGGSFEAEGMAGV